MKHPDWTNRNLTYGDILGPAMEAQTVEEAADFFRAYVAYILRFHSESQARAEYVVRTNIGYWTGYCDGATAERVLRLYDVSHPIFGRSKPTMEQALEAGKALAKETK